MRIIDLSHPISDAMPVFPGDPDVQFKQVSSIAKSSYNVTQVIIGTHSGTHVDVPRHVMHDERGVESIPLESVVGWAEVLDLGEPEPGSEIRSADLDAFADRVTEGSRIILKTGWSKRWGKPEFFTAFPGVTTGAAAWLTARKIKFLGIEQPSVHKEHHLEVHKALLSAGVVLVETMANLSSLTQNRVYIAALPLKLMGLDGSPMRVIAIEGMEEA